MSGAEQSIAARRCNRGLPPVNTQPTAQLGTVQPCADAPEASSGAAHAPQSSSVGELSAGQSQLETPLSSRALAPLPPLSPVLPRMLSQPTAPIVVSSDVPPALIASEAVDGSEAALRLRAQTRHGGGQMATRSLAAHQAVVSELRATCGLSLLGIEVTSQATSMLLLGWAAALAAAVQVGAAAAGGDASAGASVD